MLLCLPQMAFCFSLPERIQKQRGSVFSVLEHKESGLKPIIIPVPWTCAPAPTPCQPSGPAPLLQGKREEKLEERDQKSASCFITHRA